MLGLARAPTPQPEAAEANTDQQALDMFCLRAALQNAFNFFRQLSCTAADHFSAPEQKLKASWFVPFLLALKHSPKSMLKGKYQLLQACLQPVDQLPCNHWGAREQLQHYVLGHQSSVLPINQRLPELSKQWLLLSSHQPV